MKINSAGRLGGVVPNKSGTASSAAKTVSSSGKDRVDISGRSGEVSMLKGLVAQDAAGGVDKVPQLRQLIDSGTYHVEAKDVALKMLDHWKDFQIG